MRHKNCIHWVPPLRQPMNGVILNKAKNFCTSFLHIALLWVLKLNMLLIIATKSFTYLMVLITSSFIQIFNSPFEQVKRWNFSGLVFTFLSENYSFKSLDISCKFLMTSLTFLAITYDVLSSASLANFLKLKIGHT